MDRDELVAKIMSSEPGEKIDLTHYDRLYKEAIIDRESDGEFCWSLSYKDWPMNDYPMRSQNYVKTFKTINGARRNLIKRLL